MTPPPDPADQTPIVSECRLEATRAELLDLIAGLEAANGGLVAANEELRATNEALRLANHAAESTRGELAGMDAIAARLFGSPEPSAETDPVHARSRFAIKVFSTFMDRSPYRHFVVDDHDRIVFANRELSDRLSAGDGSLVGKRVDDVFVGRRASQRAVLIAAIEEARTHGAAVVEFPSTTETSTWHTRLFTFDFDGAVFVAGTARDVAAGRRARRSLAEREAELKLLLDLVPAAIWVIDADRRILRMNSAARREPSTISGDPIGHSVAEAYADYPVEIFGPDNVSLAELIKVGTEAHIVGPGGRERALRVDRAAMSTTGDVVTLLAVMVTDLTDSLGSEQELRIKNELLEHRNTELDQFAHMASHDLRAPLRAIYAFTQMAMEDDGSEHHELLEQVLGSVDRMRSVLDSLLEYTGTDQDPAFEVIALGDVVTSVLGDLASDIAETQTTVTVPDLPIIRCDPTLMRRLFQNLIANAIVYRGTAPARVEITVRSEFRFVEITVTDHGIGFPPEQADDVFRPFKRLSAQSTGQGIGLSICRRIVERHHGTLRATSRIGGPTAMIMRLPRNLTV